MGLLNYWRKRNFKKTPEPRGRIVRNSKRLQFVIQKHDARRLHFDFRLELDGTLKSWAIPKGPSLDPEQKRLAVHVEDHPLDYGEFEGIIPPKQYGAGTVLLWDRGYWSPVGDARSSYRHGRLKFSLDGHKLHGVWNLVRMGGRHQTGKDNWLLIKENDKAARAGKNSEVTKKLTQSVLSGRTIDQIASGKDKVWQSSLITKPKNQPGVSSRVQQRQLPPGARKVSLDQRITPQLATLVEKAPEGDEWVHEVKYDGYRILCRVNNGSVKLFTRNGNDWTAKLHKIAEAAVGLSVKSAWLDGEVVALLPDGHISFQTLQNAFDRRSETTLIYYVFDLLYLDGYDLRPIPLIDRKRVLAELFSNTAASDLMRYSDHIVGKGDVVFAEACRRGMEGLIGKRVDAAYLAGRNRNWVKAKCGRRQEFVIGGFTKPSGSRTGFGALLLGVYDKQGRLQFAGRTGTGFSERSLKELHKRLKALGTSQPPFVNPPSGADGRGVHWVKPVLVAEVAFAEWTNEWQVRQASFQGLRDDKAARSVTHERPVPIPSESNYTPSHHHQPRTGITGIRARKGKSSSRHSNSVAGVILSHPDRVLFRNLTKLALAQYYEQVGEWIVPHVHGRPLTLVRCPEGIQKPCFYQKHATDSVPPEIGRIHIPEKKGTSCYLVADTLSAIIGLVQMGVLELHTWGGKRSALDRPDRMMFDLDPGPAVTWEQVVEGAQLLRALLAELGLGSFVKTTGGKGLHIAVPLEPVHTWEEVKGFSKSIAEHLVHIIPDRFVAIMSKTARKNKIYIDFLRNSRGATAVAAFSTRAKPGAPVSMPIFWEELSSDLRSDHFTVANTVDRLKQLHGDPWREYFTLKQKITSRMKSALISRRRQ